MIVRIFGSSPASRGKTRTVIIHNHLFKNAGTTIDWALRNNFGRGFVDHRDDRMMMEGKAQYLLRFLRDHPHIQALSSHHLRQPLPQDKDIRLLLLTMYRHPVARAWSVYAFERKQKHINTLGARFAREHDFPEYVVWRMNPEVPPSIRNFHVRKTLPVSIGYKTPLTEEDLTRAKVALENMPLVGIVERFDVSMVLFEQALRPYFSGLDLSYVPQNVNSSRKTTTEEQIDLVRDKLGRDLYGQFLECNAMDLELYEHAKSVIEARWQRLVDRDRLLEDFRLRCRRKARH